MSAKPRQMGAQLRHATRSVAGHNFGHRHGCGLGRGDPASSAKASDPELTCWERPHRGSVVPQVVALGRRESVACGALLIGRDEHGGQRGLLAQTAIGPAASCATCPGSLRIKGEDLLGDYFQAFIQPVVAVATDAHRLADRWRYAQLLPDPTQRPGVMRHRCQVQADPR
jgi:hypothetical protein